MERDIRILQDGWKFALSMEKPEESAFAPVRIPHDWAVGRPVSHDAPLDMAQGWFHRKEIGWYTNDVHLFEKFPGRRYYLDFGGVWECATVWVNGVEVGGQRYGYTPFRLDVTDAVHEGNNQILVQVDNTQEPADRWYSGCGIYRPVRWMEMDEEHLEESQIVVTSLFQGKNVQLNIQTGTEEIAEAMLTDWESSVVVRGKGQRQINLLVKNPERWSAENPVLYDLTLRLQTRDQLTLRIGFREVRIDAAHGLRVNGKPVKLRGVCLHQDMGCLGIAATKEMWRDRLEKLKNWAAMPCGWHIICTVRRCWIYAMKWDSMSTRNALTNGTAACTEDISIRTGSMIWTP